MQTLIYLSLILNIAVLLLLPVTAFIAALLSVQIIYKVTTPFTVGTFRNPVVISNLVISAVHIVTLTTIFSTVGQDFVPIS